MTDRAEIERLLQMTGRTLEKLPNSYPKWKCSDTIRKLPFEWPIEMPVAAGNALLHQSDVIELLVGALRDALDKPKNRPLTKHEIAESIQVIPCVIEEKSLG